MIVPVVLSGGSGTRLWPLSSPERPKQFLPLTGKDSLYKQTLARVADQSRYRAPIVVANAAHAALCAADFGSDPAARLILEPCARNTAVAIVMAAEVVRDLYGPETIMLVMPSDHRIGDEAAFHNAVAAGVPAAQVGRLITFGVTPEGPETGYGYLEAGESLEDAPGAFTVSRFTEKPGRAQAEEMVADGRHYWNGGIFLFAAGTFLNEAACLAPEISRCGQGAVAQAAVDGIMVRPAASALIACPDLSVDYAVMERSGRIAMVPLSASWSDVGSWDALAQLPAPPSSIGNVNALESNNCYIRSDRLRVSLLGVEDLIIVATGDDILIMRKGQSQRIRQLISQASSS
jgi:mannose-1-phosphate guanylyltransferase/mannose-1-phosphate guanylyltransferase/mannose-6-phosphate isomerase